MPPHQLPKCVFLSCSDGYEKRFVGFSRLVNRVPWLGGEETCMNHVTPIATLAS